MQYLHRNSVSLQYTTNPQKNKQMTNANTSKQAFAQLSYSNNSNNNNNNYIETQFI